MENDVSQDLIRLLLVAVITGFVLPALTKASEIILTRRVAKRTEIRNMQLEIIEQLTKAVWEWRFLGKQVCYYGCEYKTNENRFRIAIKKYNEKVWEIFTEIKAIKSRSIVWYPEIVPNEIERLYEYIKRDVDAPMTQLMERSEDEKQDLSDKFYEFQAFFTEKVSPKIEVHIKTIADTISKATA